MTSGTSSPPKTPLVFHTGITGHRDLSPEASEAVAQSLTLVLQHIKTTASQILDQHPGLFTETPPILRCISSLAKGADQLMAQAALNQGYELQAPLPFSREEYAKDFQKKASFEALENLHTLLAQADRIFEADGDPTDRDTAYLHAGLLVLEQSDLLVAVFDASRPQSRVGTARMVDEARAHHIPLMIINPAQKGMISMEWHKPTASWQEALTRTMQTILCPFSFKPDDQAAFSLPYFQEIWPRHNFRGCLAAPFENLVAGKITPPNWTKSPSCPSLQEEWSHLGEPVLDKLSQPMDEVENILDPHFHWADQLSLYYGARYRSLAILHFLTLGLLLGGLLLGFYSTTFNAYGFGLQVLGFGVLLFLSRENNREECHQKFLDYRYLAEHLRYLRILTLLGRTLSAAHLPIFNRDADSIWANWHFRNIARSMGLISCKVDKAYLDAFKELFRFSLKRINCLNLQDFLHFIWYNVHTFDDLFLIRLAHDSLYEQ